MPKLKNSQWADVAGRLFEPGTNAVLMTDSCSAYLQVEHPGIVDKHNVNHSEGEYFRSVDALANV
eukprot:9631267-Alexandrium_andersonii.AAC.1